MGIKKDRTVCPAFLFTPQNQHTRYTVELYTGVLNQTAFQFMQAEG